MIRAPAVAGSFYPSDPSVLARAVREMTDGRDDDRAPIDALGIVVPHAGYVYSGSIAGEVFSRVRLPDRYILLGPNHTGIGPPLAIMSDGEWETPIGRAVIDSDLAGALMEMDPELEPDAEAHRLEHALEVELPFLQLLVGKGLRFVPVVVGTANPGSLQRLGDVVARAVADSSRPVLILASSDMNHYESDAVTRVKDRKAIDRILGRDASGLREVVIREGISMCGFAPTVAMLTAVNALGAAHAELLGYGTSGDIFGDRDRVVGYAGIVIS